MKCMAPSLVFSLLFSASLMQNIALAKQDLWKPYTSPRVARENVFAFTQKPSIKYIGDDKYEITFTVKGYCDVTVAVEDESRNGTNVVVRHLASGVLGSNAPAPFQKNALKQTLLWNGKDDLGVYCKDAKNLKVRVMLGLKPEFDKRIGGSSGNNLPGTVWGITIGPKGAYVFIRGSIEGAHLFVRAFDHDGQYVQSLSPPPANLPESKLGGLSFIEYEANKKAIHGAQLGKTLWADGGMFIQMAEGYMMNCQPTVVGERLFWCGTPNVTRADKNLLQTKLVYIKTDGSTDIQGTQGRLLTTGQLRTVFCAASQDGKNLYFTGLEHRDNTRVPVVLSCSTTGTQPAKLFIGKAGKPGSDNEHLNHPLGLDCDNQGRLYVADHHNNRIQIFSPKGKYLKSIPVSQPRFVRVHQKTGAIYVMHQGREKGKVRSRLTKLKSLETPLEVFHVDNFTATSMALDSWTVRPRLWLGGEKLSKTGPRASVRIYEERDGALHRILDFDEVAKKEAGASYFGRFHGAGGNDHSGHWNQSTCDPVREKLYYGNLIFDLKTGTYEGQWMFRRNRPVDLAFDKKGFMHGHPNSGPTSGMVWRVDPSLSRVLSKERTRDATGIIEGPVVTFPETPYDYGIKVGDTWKGVIPTKCQPSGHARQYGFGVNMRGDVAVTSRIMYMPKMEDEFNAIAKASTDAKHAWGNWKGRDVSYASQLKAIAEVKKQGGVVYFIPREPGIALNGATIWTFDATGEQRYESSSAVIGGRLAGVQIDEGGFLYFATVRTPMIAGAPFLKGRGGMFGASGKQKKFNTSTGTMVKSKPRGVRVLSTKSKIPLDSLPSRAPDMWYGGANWIEGSEWLYAGVGPIIEGANTCECQSSRIHLDWYKRSYVPEAYRHSLGILDTNGNLIMHLGTYGNFDSASGPKSLIPVGDNKIGTFLPRFPGGTDNYLCFEDWGERLVVLKLNYHAQASVQIQVQKK